jgi:hypothetical protein
MMISRTTMLAAAVLGVTLTASALGQFAVIDVAAIAKLAAQLQTAANTLNQITATYNRVTQQYNQMLTNAKYLSTLNAYRMAVTPWQGMTATNTYGNTGQWIAAVNNGLNTFSAWNTAGLPRMAYGVAMANVPAGQAQRVQTNFATMELQNGAANSAMQTIGAIRLHGSVNDGTLLTLENDSLSSDPNFNTELAVLNKINVANMVAARQTGDTNKLLASVSEAQLVDMKAKSDMVAAAVSQDVTFRTYGDRAMTAQHADYSAAMMSYRLP